MYALEVDTNSNVQVRMTLTAPACPAAQTIRSTSNAASANTGVNEVKVKIVWDPPWTREKMSTVSSRWGADLGLD